MAANHTALRVERQDLFEDQLRASRTRSVRRASGLLIIEVARRIQDAKVMGLLKMILKATGKKGVPQGGVTPRPTFSVSLVRGSVQSHRLDRGRPARTTDAPQFRLRLLHPRD